MKIDTWLDFTCPFSYIGYSSLMKALKQMGLDADVKLHSYLLNPDMKEGDGESALKQLMEKDEMSEEEALAQIERINAYAKECGLAMDFGHAVFTDTSDAHHLVKALQHTDAKAAAKLIAAIYEANFVKGLNISDKALLKSLAMQAGMQEEAADEILKADRDLSDLKKDMEEFGERKAETIPYFDVGGRIIDSSMAPEKFIEKLKSFGY